MKEDSMNSASFIPSKITTAHRAKFACVYLRQSTLGQVLHNTESTARQYALVERAVALGWPKDRVLVIDEDLGRSGASADLRSCFRSKPVVLRATIVIGIACLSSARSSAR